MQLSPSPRRRRVAAVTLATLLSSVAVLGAVRVQAAPAPETLTGSAGLAGFWLRQQIGEDGAVEGFGGTADGGATMDVALSLAAEAKQESAFDRTVAWLTANVETVIAGTGDDSPAAIGTLLLVADAAGLDPTDVGGVDLPARLAGTLGAFAPGLYGAADPTFDGAYRQSLALLGLAAHGITPPAAAIDWLVDQQCDGTTPAAAGGWMPARADTSVACAAPDPVAFTGPDTNQTAMAAQALVAVGVAPTLDPLPFLAAAQGTDGGFAYLAGGTVDPNSTALVIQALVALGEDPSSPAWSVPGGDPLTSLLAWQIDAGPDLGGLASPFSGGAADLFATRQAIWGLLQRPFPLGVVQFPDGPPATIEPTTTTTTSSTSVPSTSTQPPAASTPAAPAALAVRSTPQLTG